MSLSRAQLIGTVLLSLVAATNSFAVPVFYTDETSFTTAASGAGINLGLESFETSTQPFFPGGSVSVASGQGISSGWSSLATDGDSAIHWFTNTTITFDTAINAFGVDIIDLGTSNPTTLTLTTTTGSQVLFSNFTGNTGNVLFGGVIDTDMAFVSATFTNTVPGDGILLDRMQTGIPEPSIVALMGLGLLGIGVVGYRAKKGRYPLATL